MRTLHEQLDRLIAREVESSQMVHGQPYRWVVIQRFDSYGRRAGWTVTRGD